MCGSDGLSSSSSLLICGKSCRCQAENPLNALPSFTRAALYSSQGQLTSDKCFSIELGRATFHAPQPSQRDKSLGVKPVFRALTAEMRNQEIDFSLQRAGRSRDIQIGLTHIAIPLWNLVLKDAVIPESIPSESKDVPVVLMCVPLAM